MAKKLVQEKGDPMEEDCDKLLAEHKEYKRKRAIQCEECDGEGNRMQWSHWKQRRVKVTCPWCKGTGKA